MLVLSRKLNESLIVSGNVRVTITAVRGDQVRIGIEAPPEVSVDREEARRRRVEFFEVDVQQAYMEACSG